MDIRPDTLNIDESKIEAAITARTRAIFPVHYAGVALRMEGSWTLAERYDLVVVEDAAQGVNAFYKGRALGSIGHLGCYSFHETKNYISGEGGASASTSSHLVERAEILRDKGTNRKQFFRGSGRQVHVGRPGLQLRSERDRLGLPLRPARTSRRDPRPPQGQFDHYHNRLSPLEAEGLLRRPIIPYECETNYHMYYILLPDRDVRDALLQH